jgi:hypothetical protein
MTGTYPRKNPFGRLLRLPADGISIVHETMIAHKTPSGNDPATDRNTGRASITPTPEPRVVERIQESYFNDLHDFLGLHRYP